MTHWKARLGALAYITACTALSDAPSQPVTLSQWIALACVWIAVERVVVGVAQRMEGRR